MFFKVLFALNLMKIARLESPSLTSAVNAKMVMSLTRTTFALCLNLLSQTAESTLIKKYARCATITTTSVYQKTLTPRSSPMNACNVMKTASAKAKKRDVKAAWPKLEWMPSIKRRKVKPFNA